MKITKTQLHEMIRRAVIKEQRFRTNRMAPPMVRDTYDFDEPLANAEERPKFISDFTKDKIDTHLDYMLGGLNDEIDSDFLETGESKSFIQSIKTFMRSGKATEDSVHSLISSCRNFADYVKEEAAYFNGADVLKAAASSIEKELTSNGIYEQRFRPTRMAPPMQRDAVPPRFDINAILRDPVTELAKWVPFEGQFSGEISRIPKSLKKKILAKLSGYHGRGDGPFGAAGSEDLYYMLMKAAWLDYSRDIRDSLDDARFDEEALQALKAKVEAFTNKADDPNELRRKFTGGLLDEIDDFINEARYA